MFAAIICLLLLGQAPVLAQVVGAFAPDQYKKALWMVTRFYGGQRSGSGPNWILMGHPNEAYRTSFVNDKDSVTGHNVSGGWFDCGDNMLFGQTFFFTAYMLATAYEAFPAGFYDHYDGGAARSDYAGAYSDYSASGDWSINGGRPNGIPDVLEELKYATDWIIKATPDENTFYHEKGYASYDHATWVSAGYMSIENPVNLGGEPRPVRKNPDDGAMPSFAAAALAAMSRIYRKYDADYADLCFKHAQNAYAYARPRKDKAVPSVSTHMGTTDNCYGPTPYPVTVFLTAAAEMYRTSGNEVYRGDINANISARGSHWWAFNYQNPNDLAPYALAGALPDAKSTHLQFMKTTFLDSYTKPANINAEKVSAISGADWGALRYSANHAFSAALYSAAAGSAAYDQFIYDQVDYILGANRARQSFVVGFCEGCEKDVKKPHHANVYLNDNNTINSVAIPERNKYFGFMVGGTWESDKYKDDINNYQTAEGGSDYNAGLLGALAYIVSKTAPADTGSFTGVRQVSKRSAAVPKQGVSVGRSRGTVLFSADEGGNIAFLSIYTISGKRVFSRVGPVSRVAWKESDHPRGLYLARIALTGGTVVRHSVVLR